MQSTTQDRPSSYARYRDTALPKLDADAAPQLASSMLLLLPFSAFDKKRQITAHPF
jgi:hypothetical protein